MADGSVFARRPARLRAARLYYALISFGGDAVPLICTTALWPCQARIRVLPEIPTHVSSLRGRCLVSAFPHALDRRWQE
jgi:hypothetical protein